METIVSPYSHTKPWKLNEFSSIIAAVSPFINLVIHSFLIFLSFLPERYEPTDIHDGQALPSTNVIGRRLPNRIHIRHFAGATSCRLQRRTRGRWRYGPWGFDGTLCEVRPTAHSDWSTRLVVQSRTSTDNQLNPSGQRVAGTGTQSRQTKLHHCLGRWKTFYGTPNQSAHRRMCATFWARESLLAGRSSKGRVCLG